MDIQLQKKVGKIIESLSLADLKNTIDSNTCMSSVEKLKINRIVEGLKNGSRKTVGDTTGNLLVDMYEEAYGANYFGNVPQVATNPKQLVDICEKIGITANKMSVNSDHINKFNRNYNKIRTEFPEFDLFEGYTHSLYNGLPLQLLRESVEPMFAEIEEEIEDIISNNESEDDLQKVEVDGDVEVLNTETQITESAKGVYTVHSEEDGFTNLVKGGKVYSMPTYEFFEAVGNGKLKKVKGFSKESYRQKIQESGQELNKIKDMIYNKFGDSSIEIAYGDIFKRKKGYNPQMRDEIFQYMQDNPNDQAIKKSVFGYVFEASKIRPDSMANVGLGIKDLEKYFPDKTISQIMHSKEDIMLVKTKGGSTVTVERIGNNNYKVFLGTATIKESDAVQVLSVSPQNPLVEDSIMEVRLSYDGTEYVFDGTDLSESVTGIVFEEGDEEYDTIVPVAQAAANGELETIEPANPNDGDNQEEIEEVANPFSAIKKGAVGAYHGAEYYIVDFDDTYVYIQETTDAFDKPVKMGKKGDKGVTKVERSNFDQFFLPKGTYESTDAVTDKKNVLLHLGDIVSRGKQMFQVMFDGKPLLQEIETPVEKDYDLDWYKPRNKKGGERIYFLDRPQITKEITKVIGFEETMSRDMYEEAVPVTMNEGEDLEEKVVQFLKDNPNPNDDLVHGLASELGIDAHELEPIFYKLATKAVTETLVSGISTEQHVVDHIKKIFPKVKNAGELAADLVNPKRAGVINRVSTDIIDQMGIEDEKGMQDVISKVFQIHDAIEKGINDSTDLNESYIDVYLSADKSNVDKIMKYSVDGTNWHEDQVNTDGSININTRIKEKDLKDVEKLSNYIETKSVNDGTLKENVNESKDDQVKEIFNTLTDEMVGFNPAELDGDVGEMRIESYVDFVAKQLQIPSEEVKQTLGINYGEDGDIINESKDVRSAVLKAIMKQYGGLTNLIDELRDNADTVYVNLHDLLNKQGIDLTDGELEDQVNAIIG